MRKGRENLGHPLANAGQRLIPGKQPEAIEFRQQCSIGEREVRGADKAAGVGQVLRQPREKGKILAAQVAVDAERLKLLGSGD